MEDNEADIVFDQVFACIFSGPEFEANSNIVFENLAKNSKTYVDDVLVSIYEVLISEDCPPTSKFFALYLLVRATETKNVNLTTQLAASKDLLNKIFQDAQYDKEKQLAEKGLTFFNNKPSKEEALVGRNYIRLTLEALKFWSDNFGSPNTPDIGHMYHFMYNALAPRIKFPDEYFYIGKEHKTTPDFHLLYDPALDKALAQTQTPNQPDDSSENEAVFLQVISCVASGTKYKVNSKVIFDNLAQYNNPTHCQRILASLVEILESKEYPAKCKFYSLYLLVQLTETKNQVFLTQLAQKKSLLNKFYKEAKVDNDKDVKIRGQSLFPETANTSDAVIGRNYRTLLLEAIQFWNLTFGNAETNSPLGNFKTLAGSVGKVVQFPQENIYIGKKLDPEGLKGGKSLSRLEFLSKIPEEPFESTEDSMNVRKKELANEHVNGATASGKGFISFYNMVISAIQQNHPNYIESFLKNILNILISLQETSSRKFYALYILVKATEETQNEDLIQSLSNSKELLNKIFQDGQFDKSKDFAERGKTIFARNPSVADSVYGNSYVILILEALKYWSDNFGSKNKSESGHIFKVMYSALTQKSFEFPKENTYIGTNINSTISALEQKIIQGPENGNKAPVQGQVKDEKSSPEQGNKNVTIKEPIKATTTKSPETKEEKPKKSVLNPQEVQESLKKLEQAKNSLKEFLLNNPQENKQTEDNVSKFVQEYQRVYKNDIEKRVQQLLNDSSSETDQYLELFIKEDNLIQGLSASFSNYKTKKIDYFLFRNKALGLLGVSLPTKLNEEINKPQQQKVEESKTKTSENKTLQPVNPEVNLKTQLEAKPEESIRKPFIQIPDKTPNNQETNKKNEEKKPSPAKQGPIQNISPLKEMTEKAKPEIIINEEQKENGEGKASSSMKKLTLKSPRKDKEGVYFPNQDPQTNQQPAKQQKNEEPKTTSLNPEKEQKNIQSNNANNNNVDRKTYVSTNKNNVKDSGQKQEVLPKQSAVKQPDNKTSFKEDDSNLQRSSRKIPEDKLKYSLQNIAQNISISSIKNSELDQIQESIKNSYIKSGKNVPTFEPLTEMKKKEKLEKEIAKLKKEKLDISRGTLQSQANIDSKILNDDEVSLRSSPKKETNREHIIALQQKIEDLQKKVNETNDELLKRGYELENAKRMNSPEDIEYILKENADLKLKVNKLTQDLEIIHVSPPNSGFKKAQVATQNRKVYSPSYPQEVQQEEGERKPEMIFKQKHSVYGKVVVEKGKGSIQSSLHNYLRRRARERREEGQEQSSFGRSTGDELIFKNANQDQERKLNSPNNIFRDEEGTQEETQQQQEDLEEFDKGHFGVFYGRNELTSYKLSCLLNKRIIYEDEDLQVALTSNLISEHPKQKKVLKSVLYYNNKTDRNLERFGVYFGGSPNINHLVKPQHLEDKLAPGRQLKQQIVSTIKGMPFENVRLHGDFKSRGRDKHLSIYLPLIVTKFMEFKPISSDSFKRKWQKRADNVVESEVKLLDSRLITSPEDFGKFFEHLVEVNVLTNQFPNEEIITLGGLFEVDLPDLEYLVRINISASHKVVFQVAGNDGDNEVLDQILSTLEFLFQV